MAQGSFAAQVGAFASKTKERMTAVRNAAVDRTIEEMQRPVAKGGRMRVDTGFLRASLVVSASAGNFDITYAPPDPRKPGDKSVIYHPGEYVLVIAQAALTDVITAVYTANYARAREYKGDRFVALAAQNWPRNVAEAARDLEVSIRSR